MESQFFTPEDYKVLKYNIINEPGDVLKSKNGAGLSRIQSFQDCNRKDKNKLIKYIVIMYSKESPFVAQFKDVGARMREAAVVSGYDLEKDEEILSCLWEFRVREDEKLIPNSDPDAEEEFEVVENEHDVQFIRMTIDFLKHQNSLTWSMIVSNEQTFYEYQEALLQEVDSFNGDKDKLSAISVKTKLMEDSDAIAKRLEGYYKIVFPDVDVQKKARLVYTPESIAKKKNV